MYLHKIAEECLRYAGQLAGLFDMDHVARARDNFRLIVESIKAEAYNGWKVIGHDVNWEDPWLTCDHCEAYIESAYAERDEEGGEGGRSRPQHHQRLASEPIRQPA